MHRSALAVNRPAVGDAFLERSAAAECADRYQQRGLEPAAVLIKALDVHRRRPEALIALHRRVVGRAGVEPAVKGVCLLGEVPAAAVRAGKALGQKLCRFVLEPCVRALFFVDAGDGLDALVGADGL